MVIREFTIAGRRPVDEPPADRPAADGPARPAVRLRDAATVMLLRDGPGGVEVFAFRRVSRMAFAAGMLVFPGGGVDPRDGDEDVPWSGPAPADLAGPLGADAGVARALVVAAVRETFEECGILLAGRGPDRAASLHGEVWEEHRRALAAGETSLAAVLRAEGLRLRADLLRPWAHWVTPPFESRRFDTRFFAAASPPGQEARDLHGEGLGGEGEQAGWLAAADAVRGHAAGELPMLPPTLVCLEELAAAGSVAAVLGTPRRLRPVSPWVHRVDGGDVVLRVDLDGHGGGEPGP